MGYNKGLTAAEMLFGFQGRIGRLAFLGYGVLIGLCVGALAFISITLMGSGSVPGRWFGVGGLILPWFVSLWPSAALLAKRLHDLDRSALHGIWLCALWYLPTNGLPAPLAITIGLAGLVAILWIFLAPGTPGPNVHGLKPGSRVIRTPEGAAGVA